ncbi:hypothetical protein GCM10027347_60170 [Larkinella harenae]
MKKHTVVLILFFFTALSAFAQEAPLSPPARAKNDIAEVSYSQPSKRGREIFGSLVPYGKVWRTGANASTDITFTTDVLLAGKPVKKGTYAVFTIPEANEWTIILNSKANQRMINYDASHNVVEVKAPVQKVSEVQEAFQIQLEKKELVFVWDQVKVAVPLKKAK